MCDKLFSQCITLGGTDPTEASHPEFFTFRASLTANLPAGFSFSGLTYGEAQPRITIEA